MADAIVINKADGDNKNMAELAKREYKNALHLFPPTQSGWIPFVDTCSAREKKGINEIWKNILEYEALVKKNGYFTKRRKEQELKIMFEAIKENLDDSFRNNRSIKAILPEIENKVLSGDISSYKAARELLDVYFKNIG